LAGVNILIEAQLLESGTFNNNFQDLASGSTNSSGVFEIEIEDANYNGARLTFAKDGYLDIISVINADLLTPEGTDFSTPLDPISTVNLRLVNTTPSNSQDQIEFRYTSAFFPQCSCCNNSPRVFTGTSVDTVLTCSLVGNSQLDYLYTVTKNGFESVNTDGVFVNSFQTADIVINY